MSLRTIVLEKGSTCICTCSVQHSIPWSVPIFTSVSTFTCLRTLSSEVKIGTVTSALGVDPEQTVVLGTSNGVWAKLDFQLQTGDLDATFGLLTCFKIRVSCCSILLVCKNY